MSAILLCGTRRKHVLRCKYCSRPASAVCEFVHESGTACGTHLCGQCKDASFTLNCRIHRLRGDISNTPIPGGNISGEIHDHAAG